jgi:hypothetical protein
MRTTTARLIPPAILALVFALAAAGCGGHSDKKSNEAYASSVCTAIANWEQQVKAIASDFSGGITQATFESKVTQVESATNDLVTQIKAVPAPDTSQGQAAKQQLDQLSTDASTTVTATKSAAGSIQADASAATISTAILVLTPQVKSLATTAESTVKTLKDAGGDLASAFKSASSCQSLGGSG